MHLLLLLFVGTVLLSLEAVELPTKHPIEFQFHPYFAPYYRNEKYQKHFQLMNFTLGTPGQPLQMVLHDLDRISNARIKYSGFQPNASSTFVKVEDYNLEPEYREGDDPVIGKDVLKFSGTTITGKPFLVREFSDITDETYFNLFLSRPQENRYDHVKDHFITQLLSDYDEKIVVITYGKATKEAPNVRSLKLTIGGRPDKLCNSNWKYLPVRDPPANSNYNTYSWLVNLDSLKVGSQNIQLTNQNGLATFVLTGQSDGSWNPQVQKQILKILNNGVMPHDQRVPLDVKKEISFKLAGFELNMKPSDYLEPNPIWIENGRTTLYQGINSDYFNLPITFLHDKCLLLDYEQKRIGLTKRK